MLLLFLLLANCCVVKANYIVPLGIGVLLLTARLIPVPQDGALMGLPTLCPIKLLTGQPCPGCGITRSLVLCVHGDWAAAFHYHPMGPVLFVILCCLALSGVLLSSNEAVKTRVLQPRIVMPFAAIFFVSLLAVWMIRIAYIVPFPPNF